MCDVYAAVCRSDNINTRPRPRLDIPQANKCQGLTSLEISTGLCGLGRTFFPFVIAAFLHCITVLGGFLSLTLYAKISIITCHVCT